MNGTAGTGHEQNPGRSRGPGSLRTQAESGEGVLGKEQQGLGGFCFESKEEPYKSGHSLKTELVLRDKGP